MFSRTEFIRAPQYQEILYVYNFDLTKEYYRSQYIEDFNSKDSKDNNYMNLKSVTDKKNFIDSFMAFQVQFPDFFKNLNYDTENIFYKYTTKLILKDFIRKVERFSLNIFKMLNLDFNKLINKLNKNTDLSTVQSFEDMFEIKLIFANEFHNIFERFIYQSEENLSYFIDIVKNLPINERFDYNLTLPLSKIFIHDYISFSINIKESLLNNNGLYIPIYHSLSPNLFNKFNKENIYTLNKTVQLTQVPIKLKPSKAEVLTNCFWINFLSIETFPQIFSIDDKLILNNSQDSTTLKCELPITIYLKFTETSLNLNISSMISDINTRLDLFNKNFIVKKGSWNHICIFVHPLVNNNLLNGTDIITNFNYFIFINELKNQIDIDLLKIKEDIMKNMDFQNNCFFKANNFNLVDIERKLLNTNNVLVSDFKIYKLNKILTNNYITLADTGINNLLYTAKYLKFPMYSYDCMVITGSLIPSNCQDFYKIFNQNFINYLPINSNENNFIEIYKHIDFINVKNFKSYKSIFQLGYPKILVLENYINIKLMFDGDFIIKSFQKAFHTKTLNYQEIDYKTDYMLLQIFDFEKKKNFTKKFDFYTLQNVINAYFPIENFYISTNKNFYHFILNLEIMNTLDSLNDDKNIYEFKLFVNNDIFFERKNVTLFLNDAISFNSIYERNYNYPQIINYGFYTEDEESIITNNIEKSFYLDLNKFQFNYNMYYYINFPTTEKKRHYLMTIKLNQGSYLKYFNNKLNYNSVSYFNLTAIYNSDNKIKSKISCISTTNTYNDIILNYFITLTNKENLDLQIFKPYIYSFTLSQKVKNSEIVKVNYQIPVINKNIQIIPERNYIILSENILYFTIYMRDQFNFYKKFSIISDEYNLIFNIYFVKSFKNAYTYCLILDKKIDINKEEITFIKYNKVYSQESKIKNSQEYDLEVFYYVKFFDIDEMFFNRIQNFSEENTIFSPPEIVFEIQIKRISTEMIMFENRDDKTCFFYIKNSLFPVAFKEQNINDFNSTFLKPKNYDFMEKNFLRFSYDFLPNIDIDISNFIDIQNIPFKSETFKHEKTVLNRISSCNREQIFTLIKTDIRELKNRNDEEIVFSLFESRAIFIINSFCFNSFSSKTFIFRYFNGTSENEACSTHIISKNILGISNITFIYQLREESFERSITMVTFL